ncbi:DUF2971 domain-containing protein [Enterobacter sp. C4G1]|uniref:DUF2971 domain-containing protein n=1 Tax=Enterobacter sp. C4G1 TaxID=3458724 RepID=UPI0040684253
MSQEIFMCSHQTLCHYTDLTGLTGIIGSGAFWATNLSFLNDKSELLHGLNCAKKALQLMPSPVYFDEWDQDVTAAIEQLEDQVIDDIFTVSFCRNADLLSQWRGYSGKAQGVSLVFDQQLLMEMFESFIKREITFLNKTIPVEKFYLIQNEVTYTEPEQTPEFKEKIQTYIDEYETYEQAIIPDDANQSGYIQHMISQVAPFFKHRGFREEEEYRIVIRNSFGSDKIQFRNNGKTIIPYIPVTLADVKKDTEEEEKKKKITLPLREIKVGPCEDFMQVKKGIELLLRVNGYLGVKITPSSIPYRG